MHLLTQFVFFFRSFVCSNLLIENSILSASIGFRLMTLSPHFLCATLDNFRYCYLLREQTLTTLRHVDCLKCMEPTNELFACGALHEYSRCKLYVRMQFIDQCFVLLQVHRTVEPWKEKNDDDDDWGFLTSGSVGRCASYFHAHFIRNEAQFSAL